MSKPNSGRGTTTTPPASMAQQLSDVIVSSIADGTAPPALTEAARAETQTAIVNPYDELFGNPDTLHFTPQDSSKGSTLKSGEIRRYHARVAAIGTLLNAELTIVSSGKIVKSPKDGTYEQQAFDVWLPRGVTVAAATAAHFDNWKERLLTNFDVWATELEERAKKAGVIAVAANGARLIRKMKIVTDDQQQPQQ
jgi:hypothetical protein